MRSLKESLLDDEKDLFNRSDKNMLIGGSYEIESIRCNYIEELFNKKIFKLKPLYDEFKLPKYIYNIYNKETDTTKIKKILGEFILNLPITYMNPDKEYISMRVCLENAISDCLRLKTADIRVWKYLQGRIVITIIDRNHLTNLGYEDFTIDIVLNKK